MSLTRGTPDEIIPGLFLGSIEHNCNFQGIVLCVHEAEDLGLRPEDAAARIRAWCSREAYLRIIRKSSLSTAMSCASSAVPLRLISFLIVSLSSRTSFNRLM